MAKISVIGSGSWGTAVAVMLASVNHEVTLWSYTKEESDALAVNKENIPFLPGVVIPNSVEYTNELSDCANSDIIVMAVPSFAVRNTSKQLSGYIKDSQIIVNIAKGLEDKTFLTLSQVIEEEIPNAKVAVMSGPSHAEEVSRRMPTTNVVASCEREVAEYVQDVFMNPYFRVYTNTDVLGVELGGSLKNVIALCAGISDGLGFGDNTKAALMTRGIVEMTRLGTAMGANYETFSGLTGVGDMIVTCTSMHSRNRRCGILIGQGKSPLDAQKEVKMVVEGINTCRAAYNLAKKVKVEMPIVNEAYKILFEGKPAAEATLDLMGRDKRHESERGFLNK